MSKIYKYLSINEYSLKSLKEKYLWFSKPMHFNDPFDCNMELLESYEETKLLLGSRNEEERKIIINHTKDFGVCCFSANDTNLHLWALYANSHKGMALEFEKEKLDNYYSDLLFANCSLQKVHYRGMPINLDEPIEWKKDKQSTRSLPIRAIFSDLKDTDTLFQKLLLQKNKKIWRNEKELRIILPGLAIQHMKNGVAEDFEDVSKMGYKMPLPEGALTGIIFGSKASDEDKGKIKGIANQAGYGKLDYFNVRLNHRNWELEIIKE